MAYKLGLNFNMIHVILEYSLYSGRCSCKGIKMHNVEMAMCIICYTSFAKLPRGDNIKWNVNRMEGLGWIHPAQDSGK